MNKLSKFYSLLTIIFMIGVSCTPTSQTGREESAHASPYPIFKAQSGLDEFVIQLKLNPLTRLETHPDIEWSLVTTDNQDEVATPHAINAWLTQSKGQEPRWVVFYEREHVKLTSTSPIKNLSEALKSRPTLPTLRIGWIGKAPSAELVGPLLDAYRAHSPESRVVKLVGAHTPIEVDHVLDDTVMWLSGLEPLGSTLPKALTSGHGWRKHSRILNKLWREQMTPVLSRMSAWAQDKLTSLDERPVFYPFSGPDILNALTLYPHSRDYLMLALELEGGVPPKPQKLDRETLKGLKVLRDYIIGLVTRNFFITYEMRGKQKQAALGDHAYTGVGSVILFFLARTGHEIISMRAIKLSDEGAIVDESEGENVSGVEIYFRKRAESIPSPHPKRRVIFLRTNISDTHIQQQRGLIPLILNYGQYNTIVKAASYLMHMSVFDDIRTLILKRSLNIISDDTGVPYHFFNAVKGEWTVRLFGKYTRPNPGSKSFANRCQPDLRAAMKRLSEPLPFKFGYYLAKPNLVFARRLTPIEDPIFDYSAQGVNTVYRGDSKCTRGRQVIMGLKKSQKSQKSRKSQKSQ